MTIDLRRDGGKGSKTEKSAVNHERYTTGQAQRRLLKIGRSGTDDSWPDGNDIQRKRPSSHTDRSVGAGHLHGVVPGDRQLRRSKANASSDGRGSRPGGENHFDLRLVRRDDLAVGTVESDADLRSGVGGRKKNVLLHRALRRKGWRNAAEGNVTRLDEGDARLSDAGDVGVGESENSDDAGSIHGICSRGRGGSGHGCGCGVGSGFID